MRLYLVIVIILVCVITYSNCDKDDDEKSILASVLAEASIARGQINENDRYLTSIIPSIIINIIISIIIIIIITIIIIIIITIIIIASMLILIIIINRASAIYAALNKIDDADNHDNNKHKIDDEITNNNSNTTTTATTATTSNINVLQRRELPDNATVWELFKEQIRSDFAPIIMILPQPVKAFIVDQYNVMKDPIKRAVLGAAQPMLKAASALFQGVGNLMIIVGKEFNNLATSISLENNNLKQEVEPTSSRNTIEQDHDIYTYDDDEDLGEIIEI